MDIPDTFASLLASVAVIFKALAHGHPSFPRRNLLGCNLYCDQSYGGGFLLSIVSWFPELKQLKSRMEDAVPRDLETARRTYEECISKIRNHCAC
jgi:hypothetical protein